MATTTHTNSGSLKRKHPQDEVEKENAIQSFPSSPRPPPRTKRQKLVSKAPPPKPPRYINPEVSQLQSHIEKEYAIRDGGAKLLQASANQKQSMQASKGLFVSDAKILGHMRQLQQLQDHNSDKNMQNKSEDLKPCRAKLAISEIRIPLEWREFEHAKNKLDFHPCGVFCLFRIGNQVMDTPMLAQVDKTTMDIVFMDVVIFPELVDPDFNLEVEVYCSLPQEEPVSKPSTPIKMLKKFRNKDKMEKCESPVIPRSNSSSCLNVHGTKPSTVVPSHRFALAGHTQLSIKDVTTTCGTFTLKRGTIGSSGTASTGGSDEALLLPLWGQICCCLIAQPECATQHRISGFINMQKMVGGFPDWKRLWCVMRQHHLRCWASPEDVGKRMPVSTIDLTQTTSVESAHRLSMRRPNGVVVKNGDSEHLIAFESKEEKDQWITAMNQGILDLKVWKSSCEYTIPRPPSKFYSESPVEDQSFTNLALSSSSLKSSKSSNETTL